MLSSISWARFGSVILTLTALYYLAVCLFIYHKAIIRWLKFKAGLIATGLLTTSILHAQDGTQGINQANQMVRSYFDPAVQLMYGIGAIVGLIGAIRVYQAFHDGHGEEARRRAASWFFACVFLVLVALVIRSFFGL
ncbi:MAG: DUF4134 domain-containing protein [Bacteroidetes bacterium]|nr:DUF4134 domain-containing protein [Bacteroidota bacterium]